MGKTLIAYYSRRGENYVNGSIKNLKLGTLSWEIVHIIIPHTNTAEGCSLIRTFLWSATQNCIGSIGMPLKGIA